MSGNKKKDNDKDNQDKVYRGRQPSQMNPCTDAFDDAPETTRRVFGAPSFGPPGGGGAPSNVGIEARNTTQNHIRSTAAVKPSVMNPSSSAKFRWNLNDVPPLPEFHQLERSAVFIPKFEVKAVAGRVSDVLRDRSIEATFDDDKGRAKCTTSDGVDFRVRLYRGRGQYSHGVIVEVQRRFGTSINFHNETRAILAAAEGHSPPTTHTKPSNLPLGPEDGYKPNAGSSLGMVSKMLSFPGHDAHYLALQTLMSLTDAAKMGKATSRSVSIELLNGSNEVGGKLLMMILTPPKDQEESFELRVMAMIVLSNVLEVSGASVPQAIRVQLRPVLKQDLFNAEKNLRLASIAAKCVEYLIPNDSQARDVYCEALMKAKKVGDDRHAGLMRQAERCLDACM